MAEIDHQNQDRPTTSARTGAAGAGRKSGPTRRPAGSSTRPRGTNSPHNGYAATSMETVARRAGVSTKTLYRLIPNKAALFEGMVTDRLDRFLSEVDLRAVDHADIEQALYAALMACADLTLDEEVIALQRMILQEAGKSSDIAGNVLPERHPAHRCRAGGLAEDAADARTDRTR